MTDAVATAAVANKGTRVLVVDDDDNARNCLGQFLRDEGFLVDTAANGALALGVVSSSLPDVVITDLNMPVMGGVEFCERLGELDPDLPVVLVTSFGDMESVVLGMRAGAYDYLTKPVQLEAVLASVLEAVERRAAKNSIRARRTPVPGVCEATTPLSTGDGASRLLGAAPDTVDQVLVRREQLSRVASELRTINERLVVNSIREQNNAEEAERQRAQLAALLENLHEGVIIVDAHGHIQMINEAALRILGLEGQPPRTVDELDERSEARTIHGAFLHSWDRPLKRALRGEDFEDYELLRVRPNGDIRRLLTSGTSVSDGQRNLELAVLVLRDITELRRLEQQREEYAALISHDLRNPLNSIKLLAVTIQRRIIKNAPVDQLAELAQRIEKNVAHMTAMVEEILEASRLEARTVELPSEICDLRKLVDAIVARFDDARSCRVAIDAESASYRVLADVPRLERAITNLISNALKYSPDDAIVRVALARSGTSILVRVVDRGIGIASENLVRLFDRYYRAPTGKPIEGIGLGLYITRLVVEAHGGRIEVESEPEKGSSFTLILPEHSSPAAAVVDRGPEGSGQPTPHDDSNKHGDDRQYQQHVEKPAHGKVERKAQHPQHEEDGRNSPQ